MLIYFSGHTFFSNSVHQNMQVTLSHMFIPPSSTSSVPRFCPLPNMRKAQQIKLGAFSGGCKHGAEHAVSWRFLIINRARQPLENEKLRSENKNNMGPLLILQMFLSI